MAFLMPLRRTPATRAFSLALTALFSSPALIAARASRLSLGAMGPSVGAPALTVNAERGEDGRRGKGGHSGREGQDRRAA